MRGTLETIGYTEKDATQRIQAFLVHPHTMLVDIRYTPYCRWNAQWNKAVLQANYGRKQYIHLPCFGNVNYNRHGQPIRLANPQEWLEKTVNTLLRGTSLMLLCACKNYERCHRKTVYDLLMREGEQRQAQERADQRGTSLLKGAQILALPQPYSIRQSVEVPHE
jgi:hypothetical protein